MQRAVIKLTSTSPQKLATLCSSIRDICKTAGVLVRGPIPVPTKHLGISVRKGPCGNGSETYDNFEMRVHKRILEMKSDEKALRQVMRVPVPEGVHIQIEFKS